MGTLDRSVHPLQYLVGIARHPAWLSRRTLLGCHVLGSVICTRADALHYKARLTGFLRVPLCCHLWTTFLSVKLSHAIPYTPLI